MPRTAALQRAESLLELGRAEQARSVLTECVAADPDSGRAWCLLANALYTLSENGAALQAADTALGIDPASSWAWRLRSLVLRDLSRHEDAAAAAREAIRLQPQDWQTHACLALVLAPTDNGEAYRHAYQAVQLAPEEAETHFTLGVVASHADQRLAQRAYRQTLALDPQHAKARNNLGVSQLRARRPVQAMEGFGAAAAMSPTLSLAGRNLEAATRVLIARGRWLVLAALLLAGIGGAVAAQVQSAHGALAAAPVRAATVAIVLGGWTLVLRRTLRDLRPALRTYVVRLALRRKTIGAMVLGLVFGTACAVAAAAVPSPGGGAVGPCLLLGLAGMLWLLGVANIIEYRRSRRPKGE